MTATRLAILGATGSVGEQALDVARAHPDLLRVSAVQARSRRDRLVAIGSEFGARTLLGQDGLDAFVAQDDVDLVLVATPGIAGLVPTLAALEAGKSIALANKEVLVTGGHLVRAAIGGGAGPRLRPVDSEHCALWQCLVGERMEEVERVLLTASGGPFRDLPLDELRAVTPQQALRHPTWQMGEKVTIDSATLTNKGYEVVEARWLYDLPYRQIKVVVHPQSIVHALVEFADGSVKAQLAAPDMRLPIQYALLGERHLSGPASRLDLIAAGRLDFRAVEAGRYPCLEVVLETARSGDLGAMVGLSAADEVAVDRFLAGELPFGGIADTLKRGAELGARLTESNMPVLAEVLAIDAGVRMALQKVGVTR